MIMNTERRVQVFKAFHRSKTIDPAKKQRSSTPSSPSANVLPNIHKISQMPRQGSLNSLTPKTSKLAHMIPPKASFSNNTTPKNTSKSNFFQKEGATRSAFHSQISSHKLQKSASSAQKKPFIQLESETAEPIPAKEKALLQEDAGYNEQVSPKEQEPVKEELSPKEQARLKARHIKRQEKLALSILLAYKEEGLLHLEGLQRRQRTEKCLQNHKVTAHMRTKIADWIHETYTIFDFAERTFFTTMHLIDRYLAVTSEEITANELHLLSITLMSIATKFEEVAPLTMKEVHEKLGHKMFSREDITKKELEVLQTLGFYTTTVSALDFLNQFTLLLFEENSSLKIVFSLARLLLKVNLYDYEMCEISPSLQAASAIFIALSLCEKAFQCVLIDETLLQDLSKISRLGTDDIRATANKTLYNVTNMPEKFPKMESIIKTSTQLFNQFFPSVVAPNN